MRGEELEGEKRRQGQKDAEHRQEKEVMRSQHQEQL